MKQFVIKSVLFTLCVCAVAMASTPFVRTAGEAVKGVVDAVYDGKNPAPQVTNADIESCLIACSTLKTAEYDFESEFKRKRRRFLLRRRRRRRRWRRLLVEPVTHSVR